MKLWSRLVRALSTAEAGTSLALVRIGVALAVLYAFLTVWLSPVMPVILLDAANGGYRPQAGGSWWTDHLGGVTPALVHALFALGVGSAAALLLGVASRLAALLSQQAFLALFWINPGAGGSYDTLIVNALWLLVLAESDATLSLRCRAQTGAWSSARPVSAWPRWLLTLQLVVMYTSTGWQKLSVHWVPGGDLHALYYILQQPTWQRADMAWLAPAAPLLQASTLGVWLFEVGSPLLLWVLWARATPARGGAWRRLNARVDLRLAYAAVGLGMHIVIHAAMEVGPFSLISVALYPALFQPDDWPSWGRALLRRPTPAAPIPPAGASPPPG